MTKAPTPREKQVIDLLSEGCANKEIAYRLGITEGTVKMYTSKLYLKFPEMGGRNGAVRIRARDHERKMAIRLNWIQQHGGELSAEGLTGIKCIMADQAAPFLA